MLKEKGEEANKGDGGIDMDDYHRKINDITGMPLSPTEERVLLMAGEGHTISEIAATLQRGYNTVNTHLRHAREKLQARNTTHAVFKFVMGSQQRYGELEEGY